MRTHLYNSRKCLFHRTCHPNYKVIKGDRPYKLVLEKITKKRVCLLIDMSIPREENNNNSNNKIYNYYEHVIPKKKKFLKIKKMKTAWDIPIQIVTFLGNNKHDLILLDR